VFANVLPGLSILPAGAVPPNPQELLCSGDFMTLAGNLGRSYGVVIYDSPSAMDFGDAYIIASRVGAAVIVGRQNHAVFDDLKQVAEKLRANQCTIVGAIDNVF
jgi:Mrp family chromosome partitioning ATPase